MDYKAFSQDAIKMGYSPEEVDKFIQSRQPKVEKSFGQKINEVPIVGPILGTLSSAANGTVGNIATPTVEKSTMDAQVRAIDLAKKARLEMDPKTKKSMLDESRKLSQSAGEAATNYYNTVKNGSVDYGTTESPTGFLGGLKTYGLQSLRTGVAVGNIVAPVASGIRTAATTAGGQIGSAALGGLATGGLGGFAEGNNTSMTDRLKNAAIQGAEGAALSGTLAAGGQLVKKVKDVASSKITDILSKNKENTFLKNLNVTINKNSQYSAKDESKAVEWVRKNLGTDMNPKQYRDAIQKTLEANRKAALKLMEKTTNNLSLKVDELGNIKDKGLQALADKMVKNVPTDKAGQSFKNTILAKINSLLEDGSGKSKVLTGTQRYSLLDEFGTNMKDGSLTKAEQSMWKNAYNALKDSLPQKVSSIREENNILRILNPGLNTATTKATKAMTGDTLNTLKKYGGNIVKGSGLVGAGIAGKGIWDTLRGQ